ncbi:MAG: WecB/TagA/CpsF family glycosyltransferase [Alphaproteobacteria bacterium]|nr:WecB/TagA/CpsF family glycosyltransferase [Alphaproteobacteria bacterium]
MDFDILDVEGASDRIMDCLNRGSKIHVVTPNLYSLHFCRTLPAFDHAIRAADMRLADGMPVVWGSRFAAFRLPARASGADLWEPLCRKAAAQGRSVFLFGATFATLTRAARRLVGRFPGLVIAGIYAPPMGFEIGTAADRDARSFITACRPDIVIVGLGAPVREIWVHDNLADLPRAAYLSIGAAVDIIAGRRRRPPAWVSRVGFEWLWRFVAEPRRLGHRTAICLALFPVVMTEQWRAWRRSKKRREPHSPDGSLPIRGPGEEGRRLR